MRGTSTYVIAQSRSFRASDITEPSSDDTNLSWGKHASSRINRSLGLNYHSDAMDNAIRMYAAGSRRGNEQKQRNIVSACLAPALPAPHQHRYLGWRGKAACGRYLMFVDPYSSGRHLANAVGHHIPNLLKLGGTGDTQELVQEPV